MQPLLDEAHCLAQEMASPYRHEYVAGLVYAMSGASARCNRISDNIFGHLWNVARRHPQCQVFASDMKLRIETPLSYYYPGVMLVCDPTDNHAYHRTAPCIIVEVLSPSTEMIDRREKLMIYQRIPSVRHVLLVASSQPQVDYLQRNAAGAWEMATLGPDERLSLGCGEFQATLSPTDIYANVNWDSAPA